MESKFHASVTITNMSSEMFNDALFYMELGNNEKMHFHNGDFIVLQLYFFAYL
ncbi:hypothetical protein [Tissierella praeacuta]|uniref:hypothetical protein n=1 Tax=Tissierella praeacuta TaxID=43131 RepID=UPI003342DB3B